MATSVLLYCPSLLQCSQSHRRRGAGVVLGSRARRWVATWVDSLWLGIQLFSHDLSFDASPRGAPPPAICQDPRISA